MRWWSLDGKRISLFNKNIKLFIDGKASIKNMASKDYLYGKDGIVENYLGGIEARISPIYNKIVSAKSLSVLSEEDFTYLYLHIVLCNERTLFSADRFETLTKTILKEILEMQQAHGKFLEINKELIEKNVRVDNPCNLAIKTALELFPSIMDLKTILIRNNSESLFFTSDYPSIKYNLWANKRGLYSGWGLSSAGLIFIFPISPRFAILLYDQDIYKIDGIVNNVLTIKKRAWVDEINKLMLLNSSENIFIPAGVPEKYVLRLFDCVSIFENKVDGIGVWGDNDNKLISYSGKRIFYELKISRIKIHQKAWEVLVPKHAEGLLRPQSKKIVGQIETLLKK